MQIDNHKVVAISYALKLQEEEGDFEVVEVVDKSDPMYFIWGMSGLPELFETNLLGLSQGDTFSFRIPPDEGYGAVDPEAIVDLSRSLFEEEGVNTDELLVLGNSIPMTNEEGHRLQGVVVDLSKDSVTLDFNHPLAGREMDFNGEILLVRDATASELEHGHVHGEGGIHH
jgi:FKBP-type peptidyl-prolyl cis-trans isomerase SlyD